jgi:hypothetical protein
MTICGVDTTEQMKVETADETKSRRGLMNLFGTNMGRIVEFADRAASFVLVVCGWEAPRQKG